MENFIKNTKSEIIFAGHLEEIDDLGKYGRDAPLEDTKENRDDLEKIKNGIVDSIKKSGKKAVMFITSPKVRAVQTAEMLESEIRKELGDSIKFRYSVNEDLKLNEQGSFVLPESYKAGSFYGGLSAARKIFMDESIASNNPHYRFGDPIKLEDGTYKYPELAEYFIESGETYAESLIRIFNSVLDMSSKSPKLNNEVEVIIIAHGSTYHILRGLSILAKQINGGEVKFETGDLILKLWEIYQNRTQELSDTAYAPLDFSNLESESLLNLLREEIKHLTP